MNGGRLIGEEGDDEMRGGGGMRVVGDVREGEVGEQKEDEKTEEVCGERGGRTARHSSREGIGERRTERGGGERESWGAR